MTNPSVMEKRTSAKRAPGPRGTLLLGCLGEFRRDPIGLLMRVTRDYGDIVRLRFGPIVAHVVNHPDYVQQVLEERYQNYDKRTRSVSKIRATCGASLLTAEGPLWLRHRRMIQPALLPNAVETYASVVVEATTAMLEQWQEAARAGRPVEVVSEMMRLTLTIASRVLFGSEISNDAHVIERSLAEILADTWRRVENVFDPSSVSPAFHRKRFRHALSEIDDVVYRVIENRRQGKSAGNDLLSALMSRAENGTNDRLTDRELRDATITMLLAGHETTANALAWTFSLVSRTPTVDQLLATESRQVFGDRTPTEADREQLTATKRTFAEATRLYPSIWIMERRVVVEDELGGYAIPPKSMLLISPFVLHRHPQFWKDAERFDPERFSRTQIAQRPKHAYIPFGAGPHQCIGRFMAPMVAEFVVAMVLRRFRLVACDSNTSSVLPGITLRHASELRMVPVLRDQNGVGSLFSGGQTQVSILSDSMAAGKRTPDPFTIRATDPGEFTRHQPDAHLQIVCAEKVIGRCSLWWNCGTVLSTSLSAGTGGNANNGENGSTKSHRIGMIGHFAANGDGGIALLNRACELVADQGCSLAIGPIDGSTWRSYRLITKSSNEPRFCFEPDNPSEWVEQFTRSGFEPLFRYFSALNGNLEQSDPRVTRCAQRLFEIGIQLRPIQLEQFDEDVRKILKVARIAFRDNPLYSDPDEDEFIEAYRPLLGRVPLELILLAEHGGNPIGFIFAVPDFNEQARGEAIKTVIVKTLAVLPQPQYAGLGQLLLDELQQRARRLGFSRAIHAFVRDTGHLRRISGRYATPIREYTLFAKVLSR